MLEDELTQLLADLVTSTGATAAAILAVDDEGKLGIVPLQFEASCEAASEAQPAEPNAETVARLESRPDVEPEPEAKRPSEEHEAALGMGRCLRVCFASVELAGERGNRANAIERTTRALRACARRWQCEVLPELRFPGASQSGRARVRERIETYLHALASTQNAANALVSLHGEIVACAHAGDEVHRDRVPFIVKRVAAEAARRKGESSHAAIEGDDFYAVSFWFDACLVVFFSGPFALDFIRHRARLVTRELVNLMGDLDDPPRDPAQAAPSPD